MVLQLKKSGLNRDGYMKKGSYPRIGLYINLARAFAIEKLSTSFIAIACALSFS